MTLKLLLSKVSFGYGKQSAIKASVTKPKEFFSCQSGKSESVKGFGIQRRDFMKGAAVLGGSALVNLSVVGASKTFAAVAGVSSQLTPYSMLDLPLLDSLSAYIGSSPTLERNTNWLVDAANILPDELVNGNPVFAYDPYGNSLGILSEHNGQPAVPPQQEQILEAEQDVSAAVWKKTNIPGYTSSAGIASDGTNRLWRLNEGAAYGTHVLSQSVPQLEQGITYTLNTVLRSDDIRYVGLQLKTNAGKYYVARFNLETGTFHSNFNALEYGVIRLSNGLLQIWASFDSGFGSKVPTASLQILANDGKNWKFAGENRSLYFSEYWINQGLANTDYYSIKQSLNSIVTAPSNFADPAWSKVNIPEVISNSGIASDGTNRLWKLNEGYTFGGHLLTQKLYNLKPDNKYTINAVVRSDDIQYVALQFSSFKKAYVNPIARFDIFNKVKHSKRKVIEYGVIPLANGLVQIWAAFNSGAGTDTPMVILKILGSDGITWNPVGVGRSLYISECWVTSGVGATSYPAVLASGLTGEASENNDFIISDVISLGAEGHIAANNCAGIFSFQFKRQGSGKSTILHTGLDEKNYISVSVSNTQLVFDKTINGVSSSCVHNESWTENQIYRVGWRISKATGMELVLDGHRVANDANVKSRRDFDIGPKLFVGSNGKRDFSNCPISNIIVFNEA